MNASRHSRTTAWLGLVQVMRNNSPPTMADHQDAADDGGGIRGAIDADGGIRASVACGPTAAVFSEHDGGINATTSRISLHS